MPCLQKMLIKKMMIGLKYMIQEVLLIKGNVNWVKQIQMIKKQKFENNLCVFISNNVLECQQYIGNCNIVLTILKLN